MTRGPSQPPPKRPKRQRDVAQILSAARANFNAAQAGSHDLVGTEGWRRLPGLRNAIVQGVAVTHALQNLRSVVPDFDSWWDEKVAEMRAEPILSYVYPLRTKLLKQAEDPNLEGDAEISVQIDEAQVAQLKPPPNAISFQISWTGTTFAAGWLIDNGDGSARIEEVPMPGTIRGSALRFPDAPTTYRGREFDNTAANILSIFVGYVGELVTEAEARWLPKVEEALDKP